MPCEWLKGPGDYPRIPANADATSLARKNQPATTMMAVPVDNFFLELTAKPMPSKTTVQRLITSNEVRNAYKNFDVVAGSRKYAGLVATGFCIWKLSGLPIIRLMMPRIEERMAGSQA